MPFVDDIVAAAKDESLSGRGLYIGCGNGRNYAPLVRAGLDLIGFDLSGTALRQLAERAPALRGALVQGGIRALRGESAYSPVIAIQVFQHGDRAECHEQINAALRLVRTGGLFCLRVNAVGTDIAHRYEMVGRHDDGGFTIRYLDGPKEGLLIHFFSEREIRDLLEKPFRPVLDLRFQLTQRDEPGAGQWSQWEGIWRKGRHAAFTGSGLLI